MSSPQITWDQPTTQKMAPQVEWDDERKPAAPGVLDRLSAAYHHPGQALIGAAKTIPTLFQEGLPHSGVVGEVPGVDTSGKMKSPLIATAYDKAAHAITSLTTPNNEAQQGGAGIAQSASYVAPGVSIAKELPLGRFGKALVGAGKGALEHIPIVGPVAKGAIKGGFEAWKAAAPAAEEAAALGKIPVRSSGVMEGEYVDQPAVRAPQALPRGVYQQPGTFEPTRPALPERASPIPLPERFAVRPQPIIRTTASEPVPPIATKAAIATPNPEVIQPRPINSEMPRTLSGESALNQALTALDNKTLLKVARSRGIDIAKEAQLKPGIADQKIVRKIVDDFSPDELEEVRNQWLEVNRHGPAPTAGKEDWHVKVLKTYFPDVNIPQATLSRVEKAKAARTVEIDPKTGRPEFSDVLRKNPVATRTVKVDPATGKPEFSDVTAKAQPDEDLTDALQKSVEEAKKQRAQRQ